MLRRLTRTPQYPHPTPWLLRFRYLLVPLAASNHLCLGSVFAWSCFNQPLTRLHGVLAPSALDWTLGDVTLTFSLIMGGFAWGAVFSRALDGLGPRLCGFVGAASLGGGFSLAALAAHTQSLPLLWAGGAVWGVANGIAYVPPVATLMRWFPERKGFASGVVTVGYGAGALVAAPAFEELRRKYQVAPRWVGEVGEVGVSADETGRLFAKVDGGMKEVIVATLQDVTNFGAESLQPGVFLVGTGSTGVSETFLTMGLVYATIMSIAAMSYRLPPERGLVPEEDEDEEAPAVPPPPPTIPAVQHHYHPPHVSLQESTKTPQFASLYAGFTLASSGAYAVISCSKLIAQTSFPGLSPEFLTAFVAGTSISNLTGRLVYSNLSDYFAHQSRKKEGMDYFGRRRAYGIMWGLAPFGYLGILSSIHLNQAELLHPVACMTMFSGSMFLVLSSFGGSAATRPAVVSDLFGSTHVSALTARQLSAVLPAAMLGPKIVSYFSEEATKHHAQRLCAMVDDVSFERHFGASKDQLSLLIESKTVTLPRLVELLPGVKDPSPFVFDNALLFAAGLTTLAFIINRMTNPVSMKAEKARK